MQVPLQLRPQDAGPLLGASGILGDSIVRPAIRGRLPQAPFSRYLKIKGFPSGVVFHALRHTFVSVLYEQGATIEQIESITGHLDSPGNRGGRTLHRHYLHKKANGSIQEALETLKLLRPLEGVPAYESKLFATSLGEKSKFHP